MNPNELASRLEAWMNKRRCYGTPVTASDNEFNSIIAALRSADEKATRLPEVVKLAIDSGDTLIVEQGMDGGHTVGVYVASLATGGECVTAATPEAAIDALAAALEKKKEA